MKNSWIKGLCLLLVIAMMGGTLIGCNNSKSDPSSNSSADAGEDKDQGSSEEKVKLTWWTHQRHDMEFMKEVIADFTSKNPNIEIDYNIQTDNYPQNLELSFQSGQAPDIFSMRSDANYYVQRGMAAPLDDYITDDMRERFGDLLKVDLYNSVDGKTYSLPNFGNIFRYVYNKDLFEKAGLTEPPKTLSEMVEYAGKMTEVGQADGQYGFAINLKTTGGAFNRAIDKIAEASGLHPYNFKEGKYDFASMRPIILAFKEMYDKGYMFPGVEGLSMDPLRSQFAEGNIGSYISAHWEVGVYDSQFPPKIEWAAAPVPVVDGTEGNGKVGATKVGFWQGISSTSEHKDEAWKVFEHIYSQDVLVKYHELGLGTSIIPSVIKEAKLPEAVGSEYFLLDENIDRFWEAAPSGFGYEPTYDIKPEGKEYYDTFTAVILGAIDIDEAIEDLNTRYNAAYEKAIKEGKIERIVIPDFDPSK